MWKISSFAEGETHHRRTNIAHVLLPAYLGQVEELGNYLDEQELKDLDNLLENRVGLEPGGYKHSKSGKIVYLESRLLCSHAKPTVASFWNAVFQTDLFAPLEFGKGTVGYENVKKLHEKVFFSVLTKEAVGLHLYNEDHRTGGIISKDRNVLKCFELFPQTIMLGEPSVSETFYRSGRLKEWMLARKSSHLLGQQPEEMLQQVYAEKSFEQLIPFLLVGTKKCPPEVIGDYMLGYKSSELVVNEVTANAVSSTTGEPSTLKPKITVPLTRPLGMSAIVAEYGDRLEVSFYKQRGYNYAAPYGYMESHFGDSAIKFSNFTDVNELPKPTPKPLNIIVPNDIFKRTKFVIAQLGEKTEIIIYYTTAKDEKYCMAIPKVVVEYFSLEQIIYDELFKHLLDHGDNVFKRKAFKEEWRLLT